MSGFSLPRVIVTTCGTSALTNSASIELRGYISRYANARTPEDVSDKPTRQRLQAHIEERKQQFAAQTEIGQLKKLSAELNGLLSLYDNRPPSGRDQHFLICTDTWLGEATAQLVQGYLERCGQAVQLQRITDLQTGSLAGFQMAMAELVRWCAETLPGWGEAGHQVSFNLTGGFKSVQGVMQILAQFYADEAVYVFESGDELLRLPRLPVRMAAEDTLREHLPVFRRMACLNTPITATQAEGIPDTLLMQIDGQATLSVWGELVWREQYKALYREKLWESPSPKLRFGPKFMTSVQDLPPNRLETVNTRVDDLCRQLETGQALGRLDLKGLQGNPRPPSTHECDAWHDGDARRLYGHYEEEVFVLDEQGRALH